ncbi:MAG TPA: hypothetical protein VK866_10245, partial [Acidimicrobiales bacterium]|nr:hypothetical protein [Acidimicrobiales bacterium]
MNRLGADRRPEVGAVVWIAAAHSDHGPVVAELIEHRRVPPVRIDGRLLERQEPGAAIDRWLDEGVPPAEAARAARDRVLAELATPGSWLLVTEPQWLDPVSADVVARVIGRSERGTVVVAPPGAPVGPVASAWSSAGQLVELIEVEAAALDDAIAGFDDDPVALASAITHRTGGVPFLVAALLADLRSAVLEAPGPVIDEAVDGVGPAVRAAVAAVTARVPGAARPQLDRAAATGARVGPDLVEALADEGCLDASGRLWPAVADAVLAAASAASRTAMIDDIVGVGAESPAAALEAVAALERLGAAPRDAVDLFSTAALAVAPLRPDQASAWLAGLGAAVADDDRLAILVAAGRLGDAMDLVATRRDATEPSSRALARGVEAVALQRAARFDEAAQAYEAADPADVLRLDLARLAGVPRALTGDDPLPSDAPGSAAGRLVEGAVALRRDLHVAIDALAATEVLLDHGDITLWPDTPGALAALVLSAGAEHDDAVRVLAGSGSSRGAASHVGRLRAVGGWVALRQGRWADATSVVDELRERPLPVRERLLVAGLDVALVHRGGDQAAMERSLEAALDVV